MRVPRKIDISGYTLRIAYKEKLFYNGEECFVTYIPSEKTIYLTKGMVPARKLEVFLHEFTHCIEDIYRIKISEENVGNIALGFLQLIINPKVELWTTKKK